MKPYARIVVIKKNGQDGSTYPITTGRCSFGRDPDCDVRLQTAGIENKHCLVLTETPRQANIVLISDAGGVEVNRVPVKVKAALSHGDIFTVGDREFRFEWHLARKSATSLAGHPGSSPKVTPAGRSDSVGTPTRAGEKRQDTRSPTVRSAQKSPGTGDAIGPHARFYGKSPALRLKAGKSSPGKSLALHLKAGKSTPGRSPALHLKAGKSTPVAKQPSPAIHARVATLREETATGSSGNKTSTPRGSPKKSEAASSPRGRRCWADVVKKGIAKKTPVRVEKRSAATAHSRKKTKQAVAAAGMSTPRIHIASTGHANSPATILVGRSHVRKSTPASSLDLSQFPTPRIPTDVFVSPLSSADESITGASVVEARSSDSAKKATTPKRTLKKTARKTVVKGTQTADYTDAPGGGDVFEESTPQAGIISILPVTSLNLRGTPRPDYAEVAGMKKKSPTSSPKPSGSSVKSSDAESPNNSYSEVEGIEGLLRTPSPQRKKSSGKPSFVAGNQSEPNPLTSSCRSGRALLQATPAGSTPATTKSASRPSHGVTEAPAKKRSTGHSTLGLDAEAPESSVSPRAKRAKRSEEFVKKEPDSSSGLEEETPEEPRQAPQKQTAMPGASGVSPMRSARRSSAALKATTPPAKLASPVRSARKSWTSPARKSAPRVQPTLQSSSDSTPGLEPESPEAPPSVRSRKGAKPAQPTALWPPASLSTVWSAGNAEADTLHKTQSPQRAGKPTSPGRRSLSDSTSPGRFQVKLEYVGPSGSPRYIERLSSESSVEDGNSSASTRLELPGQSPPPARSPRKSQAHVSRSSRSPAQALGKPTSSMYEPSYSPVPLASQKKRDSPHGSSPYITGISSDSMPETSSTSTGQGSPGRSEERVLRRRERTYPPWRLSAYSPPPVGIQVEQEYESSHSALPSAKGWSSESSFDDNSSCAFARQRSPGKSPSRAQSPRKGQARASSSSPSVVLVADEKSVSPGPSGLNLARQQSQQRQTARTSGCPQSPSTGGSSSESPIWQRPPVKSVSPGRSPRRLKGSSPVQSPQEGAKPASPERLPAAKSPSPERSQQGAKEWASRKTRSLVQIKSSAHTPKEGDKHPSPEARLASRSPRAAKLPQRTQARRTRSLVQIHLQDYIRKMSDASSPERKAPVQSPPPSPQGKKARTSRSLIKQVKAASPGARVPSKSPSASRSSPKGTAHISRKPQSPVPRRTTGSEGKPNSPEHRSPIKSPSQAHFPHDVRAARSSLQSAKSHSPVLSPPKEGPTSADGWSPHPSPDRASKPRLLVKSPAPAQAEEEIPSGTQTQQQGGKNKSGRSTLAASPAQAAEEELVARSSEVVAKRSTRGTRASAEKVTTPKKAADRVEPLEEDLSACKTTPVKEAPAGRTRAAAPTATDKLSPTKGATTASVGGRPAGAPTEAPATLSNKPEQGGKATTPAKAVPEAPAAKKCKRGGKAEPAEAPATPGHQKAGKEESIRGHGRTRRSTAVADVVDLLQPNSLQASPSPFKIKEASGERVMRGRADAPAEDLASPPKRASCGTASTSADAQSTPVRRSTRGYAGTPAGSQATPSKETMRHGKDSEPVESAVTPSSSDAWGKETSVPKKPVASVEVSTKKVTRGKNVKSRPNSPGVTARKPQEPAKAARCSPSKTSSPPRKKATRATRASKPSVSSPMGVAAPVSPKKRTRGSASASNSALAEQLPTSTGEQPVAPVGVSTRKATQRKDVKSRPNSPEATARKPQKTAEAARLSPAKTSSPPRRKATRATRASKPTVSSPTGVAAPVSPKKTTRGSVSASNSAPAEQLRKSTGEQPVAPVGVSTRKATQRKGVKSRPISPEATARKPLEAALLSPTKTPSPPRRKATRATRASKRTVSSPTGVAAPASPRKRTRGSASAEQQGTNTGEEPVAPVEVSRKKATRGKKVKSQPNSPEATARKPQEPAKAARCSPAKTSSPPRRKATRATRASKLSVASPTDVSAPISPKKRTRGSASVRNSAPDTPAEHTGEEPVLKRARKGAPSSAARPLVAEPERQARQGGRIAGSSELRSPAPVDVALEETTTKRGTKKGESAKAAAGEVAPAAPGASSPSHAKKQKAGNEESTHGRGMTRRGAVVADLADMVQLRRLQVKLCPVKTKEASEESSPAAAGASESTGATAQGSRRATRAKK